MLRTVPIFLLLFLAFSTPDQKDARNANRPSPERQRASVNQNQANSQRAKSSPSPSPDLTPAQPTPTLEGRKNRNEWVLDVEAALAHAKAASDSFSQTEFRSLVSLERRVEAFIKKSEREDITDQELQGEVNAIVADAGNLVNPATPSLLSRILGGSVTGFVTRVVALAALIMMALILLLLVRMQTTLESTDKVVKESGARINSIAANEFFQIKSPNQLLANLATTTKVDELLGEFGKLNQQVTEALHRLAENRDAGESDAGADTAEQVLEDVYAIPGNVALAELLESSDESQKIGVSFQMANSVFVSDEGGKLVIITNTHKSNIAILVPKTIRVNSPEQFSTYLQDIYECRNITVGSVFLVSPATVKRVANGWELESRGTLEIRGEYV